MQYLNYFKEEDGKDVVDIDGKGFFTYYKNQKTKEMFVQDIYLLPEFRGGSASREMNKKIELTAKKEGMQFVSGTVFLNDANGDKFLKKLMLFHRMGFKSVMIQDKAVILLKNMEE